MKKVLSCLLAAAMLTAVAACSRNSVREGEGNAIYTAPNIASVVTEYFGKLPPEETEPDVVDSTITVYSSTNNTESSWDFQIDDENIVVFEFSSENYTSDILRDVNRESFTFKPVGEGETIITFEYARAADRTNVQQKFLYKVTVDKDLNMTIVKV